MMQSIPLPDIVRKGVDPSAPEAMRMTVARGEIPLGPVDRLCALAYLTGDPSETVRAVARDGLRALDGVLIETALTERGLHTLVLDLVALFHADAPGLVRRVISHPNVGPQTLRRFLDTVDEELLDLIAQNQRALDKDPAVARELIDNPFLEPAVRGRLISLYAPELAEPAAQPTPEPEPEPEPQPEEQAPTEPAPPEEPGLPQEPSPEDAALLDGDFSEELPEALLSDDPKIERDSDNVYQLILKLSITEKIKLATMGSKTARQLLARDTNRTVVNAVIRSPKIHESEVIAMAQDKGTSEEIINYILNKREWKKLYQVRLALCNNPKTPIPKAMRLLETLHEKDLRALSKSRNVPKVVSTNAFRVLARRNKT